MEKQDIYSIYLDYFKGREDSFACQGRDYYHPIRSGLTIEYLKKHLEDLSTFGIYVLTSDSKCNFVCIDIDIAKTELSEVDICNPKAKYLYLKDKLYSLLELLKHEFNISEEEILLEDTGGRGYHIWLFFTENAIYIIILSAIGISAPALYVVRSKSKKKKSEESKNNFQSDPYQIRKVEEYPEKNGQSSGGFLWRCGQHFSPQSRS